MRGFAAIQNALAEENAPEAEAGELARDRSVLDVDPTRQRAGFPQSSRASPRLNASMGHEHPWKPQILCLLSAAWFAACGDAEVGTRGTGLPCDVQGIVAEHCAGCHGEALQGGAPMSLVTHGDFHEKNASDAVHERVLARLHDEISPMPPVDRPRLSADELATLEAWLKDKAPRSNQACQDDRDQAAPPEEVDLSSCDQLIELRAHGGEADQPFEVPLRDDYYECFTFAVPWTDKVQALRIDPIVDDARVLHHWLLYQQPASSSGEPGSHEACSGVHADGTLVAGWAPGGTPYVMPDDVGLQMASGPDSAFVLELHYNNVARHEDARDRSGARVCATRKLRKHEAATHWLGTDLILLPPGEGSTRGACSPRETAHILSASPHMHQLGRHMSTLIERANGTTEALIDKPFDFNDQRVYTFENGPVTVGPGDKLTTTCTFENDTAGFVTFGSGTSDEMCYNFVIAYPAGALASGGSFLGGANKCMR